MNFKIQIFSKSVAIISLANITPLIFPQAALVIAILAFTKIIYPYVRC